LHELLQEFEQFNDRLSSQTAVYGAEPGFVRFKQEKLFIWQRVLEAAKNMVGGAECLQSSKK
jgi:hypothetical protein